MSERWRIEPEYAMKIDPALGILGVLLEPTTVVTKAWEHVLAIGRRAFWEPRTVLVTGAGPIGLLAALIGKQLGMEVHVLDRVETGLKPELVLALGATYHSCSVANIGFEPDVIMECTGVGQLISESISIIGASGVLCLTGIERHWYKAGESLARADSSWLARLITRREEPENFKQALDRRPDDIKVVIQFAEA
jgi:threonine dehydrogenase-like Zn-dependent dehydrogenase